MIRRIILGALMTSFMTPSISSEAEPTPQNMFEKVAQNFNEGSTEASKNMLAEKRNVIVSIATFDESSESLGKELMGFGTGVHLTPTTILTAAHVTHQSYTENGKKYVMVKTRVSGKERLRYALVVYEDAKRDLALLSVKNDSDTLSDDQKLVVFDKNPRSGDTIFRIGYTFGRGLNSSEGMLIKAKDYMVETGREGVFDVAGGPGDSGGPIFNQKGELVGITQLGRDGPSFPDTLLNPDNDDQSILQDALAMLEAGPLGGSLFPSIRDFFIDMEEALKGSVSLRDR